MAIMVAGGMSFAIPGMEPAYAANEHLTVSAETEGNFAGIQVIEVVVNDPDRSETNESEGIPNVEINGDDLLMAQGDDGSWYGYFANEIAIDDYDDANSISDIYGGSSSEVTDLSGSSAERFFSSTTEFLDGYKTLQSYTPGAGEVTGVTGVASTGSITINSAIQDDSTIYIADYGYEHDDNNDAFGSGVDEIIVLDLTGTPTVAAGILADSVNATSTQVIAVVDGLGGITIIAVDTGIAGDSLELNDGESNYASLSIVAMTGGVDEVVASDAVEESGVDNNPSFDDSIWPFIQTYEISKNSDVTITYGTGQTAQKVVLKYDYDDSKDLTLDRNRYPSNSYVHLTLDDSLLNLSPTGDDIWIFNATGQIAYLVDGTTIKANISESDWAYLGFEEGPVKHSTNEITEYVDTDISDVVGESNYNTIVFKQSNGDANVFVNYDNSDESGLKIFDKPSTGSAVVSYKDSHSIIADTFNGVLVFLPVVDEWLSGIPLDISLTDEDSNLNTRSDETLDVFNQEVPYIVIGEPITIEDMIVSISSNVDSEIEIDDDDVTASKVAIVSYDGTVGGQEGSLYVTFDWPTDYIDQIDKYTILPYLNYDLTEIGGDKDTCYLGDTTLTQFSDEDVCDVNVFDVTSGTSVTIDFDTDGDDSIEGGIYIDVFFFGQEDSLASDSGYLKDNIDRVNDAIYRLPLEETSDNSGEFKGTVEYIMINQINVFDYDTYDSIETNDMDLVIIVNDDMDGSDAVRVSYNDIDSTNNDETISDQEDANTHTGTILLDSTSYSQGNTVKVTLTDLDLNTDSDTIQIYDAREVFDTNNDLFADWVGNDDVWLSQLLIGGVSFVDTCSNTSNEFDTGLSLAGFTFQETSKSSGVFEGTMKLPEYYCLDETTNNYESTNGLDFKFEYQDYSDASGRSNESSDTATISSNTGSVSFDRTVYPVPIGDSEFPLYGSDSEYLDPTDVKIVIRINDPDFNVSANGEDEINVADVLELYVARGSDKNRLTITETKLIEIDPQAGIFEVEATIEQNSVSIQDNTDLITGTSVDEDGNDVDGLGIIQQGDILTVEYTDPADASGDANTVTDSATFDMRNAVMQSDKSVYIIGSDAIITLIEPDLNLDSEEAETWSLDLVNWDSDAGEVTLGQKDAITGADYFDVSTSGFKETGDNSGIFQIVLEIPSEIDGDALERGEQIELEYIDWSPSGADYVGDEEEDINLDIFTSNFGATVELDQKVYTWTDKVYITLVSPDHNFDSNAIDEVGGADSEVKISTREADIDNYQLVETGTDTGIFTGEIILIGFTHDANGDGDNNIDSPVSSDDESGPTDGKIATSNDDGITVSFEMSDNEVISGSALIRWNIGEVQWLEASYPASGTGVVRVIDPDMNLNPESVDSFNIDVWSDSDVGGIDLSVTETNEATGIFEGTVSYTTTGGSSGARLAVSEGDTVTAEYEDNTLPDPYNTSDELDITATTLIGTIVPPLERAPAANLRTVDAFGNSLNGVQIDQQVSISADLANGQDRVQEFAYLVQVQNESGITVSLAWITGSLTSGQSFSPALSWIPSEVGTYTATAFVWESVDNPTALSPPVNTEIIVS